MEEKSDSGLKASLLGSGGRSRRLSRRNSYNTLINDFVSRLPPKLRAGIDPESPDNIDYSRVSGLSQGEKEYYERQFATLKSFEEVDAVVEAECIDEEDWEEQAQQERAMKISNYANIILLALKIYATVKSGSIAIAASTLDSLLDLMAGGILWFTHLAMKNINIYKYPIGKLRVQPVGIIIFAAIMATLGFQVLLQAVEQLITDDPTEKMSSDQLVWLYGIMLFATVVKLALWLYCRTSRNKIVRAYSEDHYFDVVTNVVGLVAAVLADKYYWWIDPAGAIILAVYTIVNWSKTVMENAEKEYYERQFATLKSFEEVDAVVEAECIDDEDWEEQAQQERAMKISNYANIILLALKIYATVKSGSIAIAASTLDSLLDLMAGGILWFTHLAMKNINIYKYPIGKLRVQPVGIIIFAAIMATLGFQVLLQAVEQLIADDPTEKMSSDQLVWLYVIMLFATVVKLALWLYCRTSRNKIVRAYSEDHYFDVVINVGGLVAAVLGDKYYWWIDPSGAIILAVYTIVNWSKTVLENAVSLVGQSAPPEFLQTLTYVVIRHPQVKRIDTVRAYTFGVLYFVEVDIELPEEFVVRKRDKHNIDTSKYG